MATVDLKSDKPRMIAWAERNQNVAVAVAAIFILLYVAPVLLAAAATIQSDFFMEESAVLVWFAAFMKSSEATLGGVHKVLFPFLVTLSVIAFKDKLNYWVLGLAMFVVLMFMLTVWVGVLLDVDQYRHSLEAQKAAKLDASVARTFFSKMQDTLLMYVALLLGLSATNEKR